VPPELDRIVLKALEKDIDKRYATAREMLGDLKTLRQELEFEDKLHTLDPHRKLSTIGQQPTVPMTFPPSSTSSRFVRMASVIAQSRATAFGIALLAVLALAVFVASRSRLFAQAELDSVAVLPFVNVSGNPNSEYLSDGISESIIDNLSQLPGLQVVARSTVFRYKGKNSDPLVVGHDLNVRGVVTGQLIQRGDTLVIRASLTDVKKGTQIWGQQYDRKMSDVLGVQRELSEEISSQLRKRLSGEERKRLTHLEAGTNEAYQLYLKGHYFTNKYNNEEAIKRGIQYLNQAIEHDPTYALAYADVASAYYNLSNLYLPPNVAMPRARQAAQQALKLDDSLAPAHTQLALVKAWYEWDFKGGEREFRRAIELNPNDADSHRLYGDFLTATAQFDRALAEKRKAEQLDSLSVITAYEVGKTLFFARRYDEAHEQMKRTIDLDDHFAYVYYYEAQIAMQQGRMDDGLALLQKAMSLSGRSPLLVAMWGYANARAGHPDEAESAIRELQSRPGNYSALFLARIHAALGDRDEAIRLLQQVYDDRSESIVWLKVDSTFDSLRGDPRFVELLKKIGL